MRHSKSKKARSKTRPKTAPPDPAPLPPTLTAAPLPDSSGGPGRSIHASAPAKPPATREEHPLSHLPWLLGLLLAPMLFGALFPFGKVIVGGLFAISLVLIAPGIGGKGSRRSFIPQPWAWLALGCLVIPLIPLPAPWLEFLSPQRFSLHAQFPVEPQASLIPLTLSSTATAQRLADLALVAVVFWLARCGAVRPHFAGWLVFTLTLSIGLLAASDVWFRFTGQEKLLGWLPDRAGHAAGTFPNRNHFAGYIYVAGLFLFGWLLRQSWPLRFSRGLAKNVPARSPLVLIGLTILFGLVMATRTGSRGALAAFLAGATVWLTLLASRSPSRHRQLRGFGAALLILILIAASGDYVLNRLSRLGEDFSFKTMLWQDALKLSARFPILGTGPGTFGPAFNHFKSFAGDRTFLHAENEWVQVLVEHGLLGTGLLLIPLGCVAWAVSRLVRKELPLEPELAFGGAAALVCFVLHATVEFVFQIPANAILAGALAGFMVGCRDEITRPIIVPRAGWWRLSLQGAGMLIFLGVIGFQAAAAFYWERSPHLDSPLAKVKAMRQALRLWPWDSERSIVLTRQEVKTLPSAIRAPGELAGPEERRIREPLEAALRRDPMNWELRLERAWLDLDYFPEEGVAEAKECVRLNPLQAKIPLQFARHFADQNRPLALEFLEMATLRRKEDFLEALDVAAQLKLEPAALWTVVSDTPAGLEALAEFAEHREMGQLAEQARSRLALARRGYGVAQ